MSETPAPKKRNHRRQAKERREAGDLCVRVRRVRLKDKHAPWLLEQARAVNLVWNYCNETSLRVLQREGRFISAAELDKLLAGATKEGLDEFTIIIKCPCLSLRVLLVLNMNITTPAFCAYCFLLFA